MAELPISPVPQKIGIMSNRRVPLADVPNAANSPYRPVAASTSKRSRAEVDIHNDLLDEQQPPSKKQAVENVQSRFHTPPRKLPLQHLEGRIFNKKPTNSLPTAFERKLHAAREKQSQPKIEQEKPDSLDVIRQWQKHYRRVFPNYVFYFESMPDDVRVKCSKHVRALGAREEKFFSKSVTHVVTTRAIPAENDTTSPTEEVTPSNRSTVAQATGQPRTINPYFLDQSQASQTRNKFIIESSLARKPLVNSFRDGEPKKQNIVNVDILSRAREMGMKIWQLEKLQRITSTMLDNVLESQSQHVRNTRTTGTVPGLMDEKDADLSRMLRNEQLNGPSDRDAMVASSEIVPFKGPHIYIRDMDEKTKPVMMREYRRVTRSEKGEWPQFRCVSAGKCPFIDEAEKVRARQENIDPKVEFRSVPKTRAATALERARGQPSINKVNIIKKQDSAEPQCDAKLAYSLEKRTEERFCAPPPFVPIKGRSPTKGLKGANQKLFAAEPAASGLQPSNITSAIRSQMISSTAAAPGAKAGTSKEFQGLKRKVLERNSGPALNGLQASQKINPNLGPARAERSIAAVRQTRARTQEALIHVDEESTQSEGEDAWREGELKRIHKLLNKPVEKKDLKAGYCENCRDKYDDFDEHIVGRKHRKFALTNDNWKDLDKLLGQLGRRLKEDDSDGF